MIVERSRPRLRLDFVAQSFNGISSEFSDHARSTDSSQHSCPVTLDLLTCGTGTLACDLLKTFIELTL